MPQEVLRKKSLDGLVTTISLKASETVTVLPRWYGPGETVASRSVGSAESTAWIRATTLLAAHSSLPELPEALRRRTRLVKSSGMTMRPSVARQPELNFCLSRGYLLP